MDQVLLRLLQHKVEFNICLFLYNIYVTFHWYNKAIAESVGII